MFFSNIAEVIPEKSIICVSPHYDDFLFFLGGYALEMKKNKLLDMKNFTNINTFSRSNYQERDSEGNKDRSIKRVQFASGIRFIEDLRCLDELLGYNNYVYRAMGEEESQVRGKILNEGEGEMEMAFGSYEVMDDHDWQILSRMQRCIEELSQLEDTAIVLPLTMKGHIDHFIVREAGVKVMTEKKSLATFYFAEDKPYAGILDDEENAINDKFIADYDLKPRAFNHHAEKVLEYSYTYYPSQVDDIYDVGILGRNEQLKAKYSKQTSVDQIFKFSY